MLNAVLLQDGGHVGFGHIVSKGTVTENHLGVTGRFQFFVPGGNAKGQLFHFITADFYIKAGKEDAIAYGVHGLADNLFLFNGNGEVNASFEQEFVEDVFLCAARNQVFCMFIERAFQIVAIRIPGPDVGRVEFEDFEA